MIKLNEIFTSIDGEGTRTGLPVTFIRLYGCNIRCSYCDTRYACEGDEYKEVSVEEILTRLSELNGPKRITITGGEPLMQKDTSKLIKLLNKNGYDVNVETNGTIAIPRLRNSHEWYTVDYKCKSSGMHSHMNELAFVNLTSFDVIKFVVGSKEDLDDMKFFIEHAKPKARIFVSPVFGKIEPQQLVNYVLDNELYNVTTQVQLHKIIWDPDKRGV